MKNRNKGIDWLVVEKKNISGSVWDDNNTQNTVSCPLGSVKRADIETELRVNGTIKSINKWLSQPPLSTKKNINLKNDQPADSDPNNPTKASHRKYTNICMLNIFMMQTPIVY